MRLGCVTSGKTALQNFRIITTSSRLCFALFRISENTFEKRKVMAVPWPCVCGWNNFPGSVPPRSFAVALT